MSDTQVASGTAAGPSRFLRRKRSGWSVVCEGALWSVATICLGLAGWMVADSYLYQLRADESLSVTVSPVAVGSGGNEAPSWPAIIEPGTPIARLVVPRLGVSVIVAEGVDNSTLRRAIGRVPDSARPGEAGNIALAGHRDTFLRPLAGIREGDLIQLESPVGYESYRVEWTSIVAPKDVHVLDATSYSALTLVTCYPFNYVGAAPERFIVRARRVGPESAGTG